MKKKRRGGKDWRGRRADERRRERDKDAKEEDERKSEGRQGQPRNRLLLLLLGAYVHDELVGSGDDLHAVRMTELQTDKRKEEARGAKEK